MKQSQLLLVPFRSICFFFFSFAGKLIYRIVFLGKDRTRFTILCKDCTGRLPRTVSSPRDGMLMGTTTSSRENSGSFYSRSDSFSSTGRPSAGSTTVVRVGTETPITAINAVLALFQVLYKQQGHDLLYYPFATCDLASGVMTHSLQGTID